MSNLNDSLHLTGLFTSFPAAASFTVLYFSMGHWMITHRLRVPWDEQTPIFKFISFWCFAQGAAFILRSLVALPGLTSAKTYRNLQIVAGIMFEFDFFALIGATFSLALTVQRLRKPTKRSTLVETISRSRDLYDLAALTAYGFGMLGVLLSADSDITLVRIGHPLRVTAASMLLLLAFFQLIHAIDLVKRELYETADQNNESFVKPEGTTVHPRTGAYIVLMMAILLIIRQMYSTLVSSRQLPYPEQLWYPLVVIPEVSVSLLFFFPGLVRDVNLPSELYELSCTIAWVWDRPRVGDPSKQRYGSR